MHYFAQVKELDFGLEQGDSAATAYNSAKLYTVWLAIASSSDLIALYDYWANQEMRVLVTGNVMVDSRYLSEPGNISLC